MMLAIVIFVCIVVLAVLYERYTYNSFLLKLDGFSQSSSRLNSYAVQLAKLNEQLESLEAETLDLVGADADLADFSTDFDTVAKKALRVVYAPRISKARAVSQITIPEYSVRFGRNVSTGRLVEVKLSCKEEIAASPYKYKKYAY